VLKIGDFSALSRVSVKTLRYYDEMGLLKPAHVDADSGYRHYSASQLPRLHRILALRDLGFGLETIGKLLEEGVTADQLRGMLKLRQAEQENRVREEQERLARLLARVRLIEQEGIMSKEVLLKELPPQWIASVRAIVANYPAIGSLYGELYSNLGPAAFSGIPGARWHDREHKEQDVDAEACVFLKGPVSARGRVQVTELPAATVASIMHEGSYQRLSESYNVVVPWVEANGYTIAGPIREVYLKMSQPVRQDDESYVTEIQVPVQKA
jgi:DNA-binding transcriptional MerR regulator/DNA gyrase inhibitor GyrI